MLPRTFVQTRPSRSVLWVPQLPHRVSVTSAAAVGGDPGGGPTASPPSTPPTASQPQAEHQRSQVKARLRKLVSKVNAAALPGPTDLAALDGAIRELIRLNPHPDTAASYLINGRWVLLYTASVSTLRRAAATAAAGGSSSPSAPGRTSATASGGGAGGYDEYGSVAVDWYGGNLGGGGDGAAASPLQVANDVAYRFFYTYVPVLAGAAVGARGATSAGPVKPRGNFQVFDTRAGRVENQARFDVGGRDCCVNVNGTAEVVQVPRGQPRQRLRAVFTSFDLLVDGQRRLSLPLSLLNPIRISVGDKGSVFIAAREGGGDSGA